MGFGRDLDGDGTIGASRQPRGSVGRCIYCTLLFHMVVPHWSRVLGLVTNEAGAPALQQNGWAAGPVWAREACG